MQGIKERAAVFQTILAKDKAANLFLLVALCTGIIIACINPPFHECDGWTHYIWATDVSYGNLLSPMLNLSSHKAGMVTVPENIAEVDYHITKSESGEGKVYSQYLNTVKFSKNKGYLSMPGRLVSLFYYPQALGLFLGRMFQMSVYWSVVLSRIFNLLVFLVMAYVSVRITPILKNTMATIAMLPMTVFQAASDSPDAMLNGFCLLFVAACFYYAYGEKQILIWKDTCKLGVLLSMVFLYKYVYILLGLLVFLIPMKKFGIKKQYWKCFVLALLPLLISGYMGIGDAASAVNAGQAAMGEGEITQTQYLVEHPYFIVEVLVKTFVYRFSEYMLSLNILGSLTYSLGPLQFIVPMFLIFVSCLDANEACNKISLKDRILCLITFLIVCAGIVMAMYIGYGRENEVGAEIAAGAGSRTFFFWQMALLVCSGYLWRRCLSEKEKKKLLIPIVILSGLSFALNTGSLFQRIV